MRCELETIDGFAYAAGKYRMTFGVGSCTAQFRSVFVNLQYQKQVLDSGRIHSRTSSTSQILPTPGHPHHRNDLCYLQLHSNRQSVQNVIAVHSKLMFLWFSKFGVWGYGENHPYNNVFQPIRSLAIVTHETGFHSNFSCIYSVYARSQSLDADGHLLSLG